MCLTQTCSRYFSFLAFCAAVNAGASDLSVRVQDPSGAPVPGAAVEAVHVATRSAAARSTGVEGLARFLALPAGLYRIHVSKDGFATLSREDVALRIGSHAELMVELAVGDARLAVEVSAAAPLLEAGRGTVSMVAGREQVVTLPLDGRNFVPLLALSPGVSLPRDSVLPRINGSRPRVNEYLYDGISVLQPEPGQVAYFPIIDAIEEFRVETNSYAAEYGRSNGGVILVHQKSGSNELHGTLFEFFRHEALNARNAFASGGAKPRFRRNQYGFVLGGPVRRNRTFFFGAWQGTRLQTGAVRVSTVPVSPARSGIFPRTVFDPATTRTGEVGFARDAFPGGAIPASRFDPVARAMAGRYPTPNVFTDSGTEASANNYRRVGNDATAADQFDARIDHYLNTAQRFFLRYSFFRDHGRPATPLPDGSGALPGALIGDSLTRADSVAAEHNWAPAPHAVNQVRFGYTRRRFERHALRTGQAAGTATGIPNLPAAAFADVLPRFELVGLQHLGPPASANGEFGTSVTQWADTFSWFRGRHQVKVGADVRRQTLDVLQPPSPTGVFQFADIATAGLSPAGAVSVNTGDSFASFLLGQVSRFAIDLQPGVLQPRAVTAESFVQDDWRAAANLTLNFGVRYTLNVPSTVVGDRAAVFNLNTERLDFLGKDGIPRRARNLEKANLGPRAGLAWRIADSFALRAGYGLTWIEQAGITTPFTAPLFPFAQSLGQESLDNVNPAFVLSHGPAVAFQPPGPDSGLGQGVFAVQRDNGSGYAQQWNFTLQKTLARDWSIEAGYLGSKLTRLGVPDVNLNQLTPAQLADGGSLTERAPNPFVGRIPAASSLGAPFIPRAQLLRPYPRFTAVSLYRNNVGHSTYHSFQARVEKRAGGGLTWTAAYTFSRLIDDAGAVFDSAVLTGPVLNFQAADSFNRRLEKDVSTGNVPHILSSGLVYDLPGRSRWLRDWQVAGLVRAQSGSPVAVTQATNLNAFAGFGVQRPNRVAAPRLPPGNRQPGRWFDTSAFAPAPQGTIGNSSRNPVSGPGYAAADVMVGRTFPVRERVRLEVRAEAFNLTNTAPLGNPNGRLGHPAFGTITTAGDPRVFEFVAKVRF
ncbi:MAG: TonB-dependent receptor [Bryobacterales bacterium]|nr:TonB-dependent receptor [Bryobacterales bacterium]